MADGSDDDIPEDIIFFGALSGQIFVKVHGHKLKELLTITLDVEPETTVDQVKSAIAEPTTVPPEHQSLVLSGKLLESGRRLADYGVARETTLQLFSVELAQTTSLPKPRAAAGPLPDIPGHRCRIDWDKVLWRSDGSGDSQASHHCPLTQNIIRVLTVRRGAVRRVVARSS